MSNTNNTPTTLTTTRDQATIKATTSARRRLKLMVRVARLADRKLATLIISTLVLSALAGAMRSLALKWIVDTASNKQWPQAILAIILGGVGTGLLGSAGRAMSDTEIVVTNEVGLLIDRNTLELTASMPGIEHLERPRYLDQLALVRSGGPGLMRAIFTLTRTASLLISMASSLWLLGQVHPLLLLTPLCAIPTAILLPKSERYVDEAKAVASERQRASSVLHSLFLAPGPAMELRVFGAAQQLDTRADNLWREVSDIQLGGAVRSALLACLGWFALTAGYVAALLFAAHLAIEGRATLGDVVLVSQLALLIRGNVAQTANAARLASSALRTADRFLWLEDLHAEQSRIYSGRALLPDRLRDGITLEEVRFTYPDTDAAVLSGVSVHLPAGKTVAIVGDNGAGKTTLIKLLVGLYRPTGGRILIDQTDLNDIDLGDWRRHLGGTFQDFLRLETVAQNSIGLGDPRALDDPARIQAAIDRGGARSVVDHLPNGLQSHLGKSYGDGAELSGGQWQKLAIARGMMPQSPLCLILDEPTAALDPAAEQALYDQYRRTSQDIGRDGAITILISHRFSSVRMAEFIVVLSKGTIAESGSHDELLANDGLYAHMYQQQADAYL
jgi:ATP-binding cassette, subfamily B, bacterial